jgi:hypothetical protein
VVGVFVYFFFFFLFVAPLLVEGGIWCVTFLPDLKRAPART